MSEERDEAKQGSSATTWAVGLVAALVLYVLSPPLVVRLLFSAPVLAKFPDSESAFEAIYAPLIWLDSQPAFKNKLANFYRWEEKMLGLGPMP